MIHMYSRWDNSGVRIAMGICWVMKWIEIITVRPREARSREVKKCRGHGTNRPLDALLTPRLGAEH